MTDKIKTFIADEVRRQGFTPGFIRHTERCSWMESAWMTAQLFATLFPKYPEDLIQVRIPGLLIEPEVNAQGWRTYNVSVGSWQAPDHRAVPRLMEKWMEALPDFSPDEAYKEFELIHPFGDGNGRTGKIIHNWMNGTLDDPVLVQDLFGHGVP